jgi:hypothetical protein
MGVALLGADELLDMGATATTLASGATGGRDLVAALSAISNDCPDYPVADLHAVADDHRGNNLVVGST